MPALYREVELALTGIEHEVIIVDDSTDAISRPVLATIVAADPRWRVIARPREEQTGLGTAVASGIRAARGAAICVMDGDLQHPPALIPKLLEPVEQGADVAVASRYMPGGSRAGLDGRMRRLVSRGATVVARALFPEARRTTDPLTGYFCCRRQALVGLEYRPLGFKILLEVLVCSDGLRVVDVPMTFLSRQAGESKATTKQGVLYLRHIWSLLRYVPGSARSWKFALVSIAALVFFFPSLWLLKRFVPWPIAWAVAVAASIALSIRLHRLVTFGARGLSPVDDDWLRYPLLVVGFLISFAILAVAATGKSHPWLVLGAVSQAAGILVMIVLNRPDVYDRLRRRLWMRPPKTLADLGRQLGAQSTAWVDRDLTDDGSLPVLAMIGRDVIGRVVERGRPALWVEPSSARPQPRVNIETPSALLVPQLDGMERTARVAVLVRFSRVPFDGRQLQRAMAWLHRLDAESERVGAEAEPPMASPMLSPEAVDLQLASGGGR